MRHVQLRAFHQVAICGSFSKAAIALGLTQPAISDQIRRLEVEYDIRLFNRNAKQTLLTDHGKKLLNITNRYFEIEQQALEFLTQNQTRHKGLLRIMADSAPHILHVLGPFRKKYPQLKVQVKTGNSLAVIENLRTYDADIGVMGELPPGNEFESIKLGESPLIAFCNLENPLARTPALTIKELASQPLVFREIGSKTRTKFEVAAKERGVELMSQFEAEGREAVREIVAAGGGIGIVSEAEFGPDPRLAKIKIRDCDATMQENLICLRERKDNRLIRAFMQSAKQFKRD